MKLENPYFLVCIRMKLGNPYFWFGSRKPILNEYDKKGKGLEHCLVLKWMKRNCKKMTGIEMKENEGWYVWKSHIFHSLAIFLWF